MTDTTPAAGNAPVFQLQRVYLKDASLEMPNAPRIFLEAETPAVDVQLEVSDSAVIDGVHEVVVRVTATAKTKDKVLFLVEGKQGWTLQFENTLTSDQYLAGELLTGLEIGRTFTYHENLIRNVNRLTLEEIAQTLKDRLSSATMVELKAGDLEDQDGS